MRPPDTPQAQRSKKTLTPVKDSISLVRLLAKRLEVEGLDELDSHELDSRCRHTPFYTAIHHNHPEVILWDEYDVSGKHDS